MCFLVLKISFLYCCCNLLQMLHFINNIYVMIKVCKMFNISALLITMTPLFCLRTGYLCTRYRAVCFKASRHNTMFYSFALVRTEYYCLLPRSAIYYLTSYDSAALAQIFLINYLHYTYLISIYLILQFYLVKFFILINHTDLYTIVAFDFNGS